MRKTYPSYSLLTLSGLIFAGSCSIIAEVDRTKIPQEGNNPTDGGQSTGGTGGSRGGTAGGGTGGTPVAGMGGDAGGGGEPSGGTSTGGAAGDAGGGIGGAGMGGAGDAGGGVGGDPGPACGDSQVNAPETCDDGTPPTSNDGCSATCAQEPGWTCTGEPSICVAAMCGDRIEAGAEQCDDGNANACGTCSQNCLTQTPSASATGSITLAANVATTIVDGDYFTLNDGVNPPVEFEFDLLPADNGVTQAGATQIDFDPTTTDAAALRALIVTAINNVTTTLRITAGGTSGPITLTNDLPGRHGNQTTGDSVTTTDFAISSMMAGGSAHDCAQGVGCLIDADCLNGDCVSNACN